MLDLREPTHPRALGHANPVKSKSSLVGCVVRSLTNVGARIAIPSSFELPETFNMTFDGGRSIRPCRLVWRTLNETSVEFL